MLGRQELRALTVPGFVVFIQALNTYTACETEKYVLWIFQPRLQRTVRLAASHVNLIKSPFPQILEINVPFSAITSHLGSPLPTRSLCGSAFWNKQSDMTMADPDCSPFFYISWHINTKT